MTCYRLIKKIAAGGMAEVFLAKRTGVEGFEKPVAIKRVLPHMAQDRQFIELFLREAKLTVSLQHANVVQVLDLGTVGGQYFMVMEFVDGENLRTILKRTREVNATIGLREILFITHQVAEGLAYAHERKDAQGHPLNLIHRDINPSNVMVAQTGEVKLADFGIARATDFNSGTEVGQVKGKTGYLAPEQIAGAPPDQRSDLFLMGLLLFELLNGGKPLFGGSGNYFGTLKEIATFDPRTLKPLPGVPVPVWAIVTRALARDPAARFQRARDFADAVHNFLFDHRLRVGPQDVSTLFTRLFPARRTALESDGTPVLQELKLEPAAISNAAPATVALRPRSPSNGVGIPVAQLSPRTPPTPGPEQTPTPPQRMRLGELLVARGKLSHVQLERMLHLAKKSKARLGEILISEGVLPEDDVIRALGEQRRLPFITGEKLKTMPHPAPEVLRKVSLEAVERLRFVPVGLNGRELIVATDDPTDLARMDAIKFAVSGPMRALLTGEAALRMATRRFFYGEEPAPEWGVVRDSSEMAELARNRFSDRETGTRERMFGEEDFTADPDGQPSAPEPTASKGRTVLLVCADDARRAPLLQLLQLDGVSPAAATPEEAEDAVRLGGNGLVVVYSEGIEDAPALARKLQAAGAGEVRVLPSPSGALVGDRGGSTRAVSLLSRLLESAANALGGAAVSGPLLARLSGQVAARLGAPPSEIELAEVCGWACALALRLERAVDGTPTAAALRQALGSGAAELSELIEACEGDVRNAPRAVLAARGACAFVARLDARGLTPSTSAKVLTQLRAEAQLPSAVIEALATVASENLLTTGSGAMIVLLGNEGPACAAIQMRLLAQGMGVRRAGSDVEARALLQQGASALVATDEVAGLDIVAMTRALREAANTATLPIYLVASANDSGLLESGLDAGADDVLVQPLNADVLAAKLRRTLQRRAST